MRVLITGATGTIGLSLADALRARGDRVVAVSRDPERGQRVLGDGAEVHAWPEPTLAPPPPEAVAGVDAVVHLLGEPVAQRWTSEARDRIRDSRVLSTRMLVAAIRGLPESERPGVLVSQSATGYYGPRGDAPLDEHASAGDDFLARVVIAWEAEARAATGLMRVTCTRTGVVLSRSGGALAKMLPVFKLGIGGPVAGGEQYVSWIHLDDVVGGLIRCVDDAAADGPVNLTAPNPVTNTELSRALGHALGRPAVLPGARLRGQAPVRRDVRDGDHRPARRARTAAPARLRVPPSRGGAGAERRARRSVRSHRLQREQVLACPLPEVFAFFSGARNLERITPPWLTFQVLTPEPISMRVGTLIEYRLRIHGIPLNWTTRIEEWEPGVGFVDRQIAGPYRLWHHRHSFRAQGETTVIIDAVDYALPFGILGESAHGLFVRRDLERIFAYRQDAAERELT